MMAHPERDAVPHDSADGRSRRGRYAGEKGSAAACDMRRGEDLLIKISSWGKGGEIDG